jgi:hypothetical protein
MSATTALTAKWYLNVVASVGCVKLVASTTLCDGKRGQVRHFASFLLLTQDDPHEASTRDVGVMIRNFLAYRSYRSCCTLILSSPAYQLYPDRIVYPFSHTGCIRIVKSWQSTDPQAPTVRQASFPLQGAHTAGTDFASLKHLLLLQHKRLSNKKL